MSERTWAERVKALRTANNWTQMELAIALHCTSSTVSVWERGLTPPLPVYEEALKRLEEVRPVDHTPEMQRPH